MAAIFRYICKGNLSILNIATRQVVFTSCRSLYCEEGLGIPQYLSSRKVVFDKYESGLSTFRSKMLQTLTNDSSMVFTEDLKAILHLVEDTPEDTMLIEDMLKKYNNQDQSMRFGSFVFGPVVMRTLHYLNKPDLALKLFYDEQFDSFFHQISTFMIMLDLLYRNEMYQEMRNVYDVIKIKQAGHPKTIINIIIKGCYKENTKESLNYGLEICKETSKKGVIPSNRVIATLSALALKQKSSHIALELLSIGRLPLNQLLRCIKLMAFAEMDRLNDIVILLKNSLKHPFFHKNFYYSDTISTIEDAIKRLNVPKNSEICDIINHLKARNVVYSSNLEDYLMQPIMTIRVPKQQTQKYESQSWSDSANRNSSWM